MNGLKEAGDDFDFVPTDEGYQSASTSKHFETSTELLKLQEYYNQLQQRNDLDFELKLQHKLIEKKLCVNELDDYEEEDDDYDYGYKGKGKGGKRFVKKTCHLEEEERQLKLKEQYMSKIKTKKKRLRFQQLDDETQLMICKIDALRETESDKYFLKKLLKMFEGKSFKMQRLEETVEKMKEVEDNSAKTIDDIIDEHQRILEVKDQEIKCLKKKLEAERRMRDCLVKNNEKRFKKHQKIEDLGEEYQMIITNMEALRKSDNVVYKEVLYMLRELSNIK